MAPGKIKKIVADIIARDKTVELNALPFFMYLPGEIALSFTNELADALSYGQFDKLESIKNSVITMMNTVWEGVFEYINNNREEVRELLNADMYFQHVEDYVNENPSSYNLVNMANLEAFLEKIYKMEKKIHERTLGETCMR